MTWLYYNKTVLFNQENRQNKISPHHCEKGGPFAEIGGKMQNRPIKSDLALELQSHTFDFFDYCTVRRPGTDPDHFLVSITFGRWRPWDAPSLCALVKHLLLHYIRI